MPAFVGPYISCTLSINRQTNSAAIMAFQMHEVEARSGLSIMPTCLVQITLGRQSELLADESLFRTSANLNYYCIRNPPAHPFKKTQPPRKWLLYSTEIEVIFWSAAENGIWPAGKRSANEIQEGHWIGTNTLEPKEMKLLSLHATRLRISHWGQRRRPGRSPH